MRGDGIEQGRGLQAVARGHRTRIGDAPLIDGVLHLRHDEPGPFGLHLGVAVREYLVEIVARVDVQNGEGDPAGLECFCGQVQEDGGVLAAAEEEHGPLGLGGHLADDEDGE